MVAAAPPQIRTKSRKQFVPILDSAIALQESLVREQGTASNKRLDGNWVPQAPFPFEVGPTAHSLTRSAGSNRKQNDCSKAGSEFGNQPSGVASTRIEDFRAARNFQSPRIRPSHNATGLQGDRESSGTREAKTARIEVQKLLKGTGASRMPPIAVGEAWRAKPLD